MAGVFFGAMVASMVGALPMARIGEDIVVDMLKWTLPTAISTLSWAATMPTYDGNNAKYYRQTFFASGVPAIIAMAAIRIGGDTRSVRAVVWPAAVAIGVAGATMIR